MSSMAILIGEHMSSMVVLAGELMSSMVATFLSYILCVHRIARDLVYFFAGSLVFISENF